MGVFHFFKNCTNGRKWRKTSQMKEVMLCELREYEIIANSVSDMQAGSYLERIRSW